MRDLLIVGFSIVISWAPAAHAAVVVDHPPDQSGGLPSDTAYPDFGGINSQRLADDFSIITTAQIHQITWWGDYWLGTPPTTETMRIRIYSADTATGLPSGVFFESGIITPQRTVTGLQVSGQPVASRSYTEYRFQADLITPIALDANTPYWLEIAQIGNPNSPFVWEFSTAHQNGYAFSNPSDSPWQQSFGQDLAFQLSTTPEPGTVVMVALSIGSVLKRKRSAHSQHLLCV